MAKKIMTLEEMLEDAIVKDAPYEVPRNWRWSRLRVIAEVKTGRKDANHGTEDGIYPFYTCASEPIKSPTYAFDGEYIILPGNGANVGMVLYHNGKFEAYQRTYTLRSDFINNKYILYNLEFRWKDANENKQFGSATNYIKLGNITEYEIAIPPLKEQERIVDKIESLFEKLDKAKELIEDAREGFEKRKISVTEAALRGEYSYKVILKDVSLGEIMTFKNGFSKRTGKQGDITKVLRLADIENDIIYSENARTMLMTEKEVANYKIENGDLVIIRVNGTKKNVGKAIQYLGNETCAYCDHLIRIDTDRFNKDYIKYLINSDKVRKQLNELIVSSAGQNTISQGSLNVIKVSLVEELNTQKEIVSIINKLVYEEKRIEELTELGEQIELIKKSILVKAFRGELGTNCEEEENSLELLKEILTK